MFRATKVQSINSGTELDSSENALFRIFLENLKLQLLNVECVSQFNMLGGLAFGRCIECIEKQVKLPAKS